MVKKTITISIDLDDYEELQRRDEGFSVAIRNALREYLGKPEIKSEQLQKAMEKMQQTILNQSEIIENLEKEAAIPKGNGQKLSLSPFEV